MSLEHIHYSQVPYRRHHNIPSSSLRRQFFAKLQSFPVSSVMSLEDSTPIPQPPPTFFVGNVPDIDPSNAPGSFKRLAEIYGETYQLNLPGRQGRTIVVSSFDTINDCCDAERFEKPIDGALEQVRALTGDGLFTSYPGEKVCFHTSICSLSLTSHQAWGVAHRLLMPVFGPIGIRKVCTMGNQNMATHTDPRRCSPA
jgi:cytochrome P450